YLYAKPVTTRLLDSAMIFGSAAGTAYHQASRSCLVIVFQSSALTNGTFPANHLFVLAFNTQVVVHHHIVGRVSGTAFINVIPAAATRLGKPAQVIQIFVVDDTILITINTGQVSFWRARRTGLDTIDNQAHLIQEICKYDFLIRIVRQAGCRIDQVLLLAIDKWIAL